MSGLHQRPIFLKPHFGGFPITLCAASAIISAMLLWIFSGSSSSYERASKQFLSSTWYCWHISWFSIALFQSYFTLSDGICSDFLKRILKFALTVLWSESNSIELNALQFVIDLTHFTFTNVWSNCAFDPRGCFHVHCLLLGCGKRDCTCLRLVCWHKPTNRLSLSFVFHENCLCLWFMDWFYGCHHVAEHWNCPALSRCCVEVHFPLLLEGCCKTLLFHFELQSQLVHKLQLLSLMGFRQSMTW